MLMVVRAKYKLLWCFVCVSTIETEKKTFLFSCDDTRQNLNSYNFADGSFALNQGRYIEPNTSSSSAYNL